MAVRAYLVVASSLLVGTGAIVQACGGVAEEAPPADAGTEAAAIEDAAPVDAGPADTGVDAGPTCDRDADLTEGIPDAAIADGSSSTGICIGCAKEHCSPQLAACSQDCSCQNLAADALECYAQSQDLLACGTPFFSVPASTRNIGIAMFSCINDHCSAECAGDLADGGDAGR